MAQSGLLRCRSQWRRCIRLDAIACFNPPVPSSANGIATSRKEDSRPWPQLFPRDGSGWASSLAIGALAFAGRRANQDRVSGALDGSSGDGRRLGEGGGGTRDRSHQCGRRNPRPKGRARDLRRSGQDRGRGLHREPTRRRRRRQIRHLRQLFGLGARGGPDLPGGESPVHLRLWRASRHHSRRGLLLPHRPPRPAARAGGGEVHRRNARRQGYLRHFDGQRLRPGDPRRFQERRLPVRRQDNRRIPLPASRPTIRLDRRQREARQPQGRLHHRLFLHRGAARRASSAPPG